jgi:hypothetical protein
VCVGHTMCLSLAMTKNTADEASSKRAKPSAAPPSTSNAQTPVQSPAAAAQQAVINEKEALKSGEESPV